MTITFTCPHCGGHKLQQIRQVIHRTEVNISAAPTGELIPAAIGVVEELRGPVLGYRCRNCRYPDINNHEESNGFFWTTPQSVHSAGALAIGQEPAAPQRCMICHKDGRMEPLLVETGTTAPLSTSQRNKVLTRRGVRGGVLLCESDPGIAAFACTDWQGIDSEIL